MWFCEMIAKQLFVLIIAILSRRSVICREGKQVDARYFKKYINKYDIKYFESIIIYFVKIMSCSVACKHD